MKKLVLTAIILMGFAMGSYAQQYYPYYYGTRKGGLFYRGSTQEQQMREWSSDGSLFLPGHASWGNWNSVPDGWTDYPPDPEVPVGGGALLLIGFGAAYVLSKRKKK